MKVLRINHNNSDLTVVNSARVSMDKTVDNIVMSNTPEADARKSENGMGPDDGLIKYLVNNNHFTPLTHARYRFKFSVSLTWQLAKWLSTSPGSVFEVDKSDPYGAGTVIIEDSLYGWLTNPPPEIPSQVLNCIRKKAPISYDAIINKFGEPKNITESLNFEELESECVTLLIEAPIFVFRQLMRSNVGVTYNEVSRRYVDDKPKFFKPKVWRKRPDKSIKQGSGDEVDLDIQYMNNDELENTLDRSLLAYNTMLENGTAPEMARMILPQNMMSKVYMTATNKAMERVLGLREHSHAQREIQDLATMMRKAIEE